MSDIRKGLPSASGYGQWGVCHAAPRLQRNATASRSEEEREWGASGDRIHAWLAGQPANLSVEELHVAELCKHQREDEVRKIADGRYGTEVIEQRIWWPSMEDPRTSGQADYVFMSRARDFAIIVDYKTSYGDHAIAPDNKQLRALAVMAWRTYNVQSIYVLIVQPLTGKPVVALYDLSLLEAAEREMDFHLTLTESPDSEPISGPHCRFCSAKLICPAALACLEALQTAPALDANGLTIALLLDQAAVAEMVIKDVRTRAKDALAENSSSIPGWGLEDTGSTSEISNVGEVHAGLVAGGYLTTTVFVRDCIKIVKGDTEKAIAAHTGGKLADAKAAFKKVAEPFTTYKPKAKALKQLHS